MTTHVDDLSAKLGEELGVSEWTTVDQERINLFADATGDHQWIHIDPDKAATGPFGTTIAHGFLTLSMLPIFLEPLMKFDGVSMQLNYGLDKVRFPAPVPVGSRVRGRISLASMDTHDRGLLLGMDCIVEIERGHKPACVARSLALLIPDQVDGSPVDH